MALSYETPILSLVLMLLFKHKWIFIPFTILSILMIVDRIYSTLNNDYLYKIGLAPGFSNEWAKVGNFPISSYFELINKPNTINLVLCFLILIFLFLICAYISKKYIDKNITFNKYTLILNVIILASTAYIYYYSIGHGHHLKGANPIFKGANTFLNEIVSKIKPFNREDIKNIKFDENNKKFKNIVLIIDESIQYHFVKNNKIINKLSNNNNLLNLKETIASVNCSYASNRNLLEGGLRNNTNYKKTNPSILFDYLKSGNLYESVPLVSPSFNFQNKNNINYVFKSSLPYEIKKRDMKILKYIEEKLDNQENNFVYIEKIGSHFPYKKVVDSSKENSKEFLEFLETKNLPDKKKKQMINYEKVIETTVNDYFKYIEDVFLSNPKYKDTIFIYVGDHGQNFNKPTMMTHCDSNNKYSYIIPSYIFSNNKKYIKNLKEVYKRNKEEGLLNHKNDLNGFILELLGYDKKEISKYYSSITNKRNSNNQNVFINSEYRSLTDIDFTEELNLKYF